MSTTNPELNVGPLPLEAWPGLGASGWAEAAMTLPVGGRYQLRQQVGGGVLLAQDLWLRQPALLRPVGAARLLGGGWRRRAQACAARRHPQWLNLYGPVRDGRAELMATDCPRGPSLEAVVREGVCFSLADVVELLPLTALDLAAALTGSPEGPRLGGVYIEPRDGSVLAEAFLRQAPGDWPPFVARLDAWELARPGRAGGAGDAGALAARYAALLAHGLLAGVPRRGWGARWRPAASLSGEANALLRAVGRGRKRFGSSEQFLAALEQANRAGAARPRAPALPRMSTVVAGAAALGLVTATVIYERLQPGLERSTEGLLTFRADPADANILLDGAGMGTSGFTQRRLSAGTHRLVVARSGFQTKELSLEVEPGHTQDLGTVGLLPEGGDLSVGADVPATPFEVIGPADQKFTGVTPGRLSQLPPGQYAVHLRPPGWPEYTQTIDVKAGQGVVATHDFGEAIPVVPLLPIGPTPLLQADKADLLPDSEDADEDAPVKVRQGRIARPTPLPKAEAFRRFDAKWDAKERAVQTQLAAIDKRIAGTSVARRDRLRVERADLERRRSYLHDMRRYQRGQLRHRYGEPDGVWGSIRNVFGW